MMIEHVTSYSRYIVTTIVSVLACLDTYLTAKDLKVSTLSELSRRATRSLGKTKSHNWLIGSRLPTPAEKGKTEEGGKGRERERRCRGELASLHVLEQRQIIVLLHLMYLYMFNQLASVETITITCIL